MYAFLMTLFIILSFFLAIFILIQQGKGDLGLGSMAGSQMLFGGSGGQDFFEKATWIMGALFVCGALGLSVLKSKEVRRSILDGVKAETVTKAVPLSTKQPAPLDVTHQAPASDSYDDEDGATPQKAAFAPEIPAAEEKAQKTA